MPRSRVKIITAFAVTVQCLLPVQVLRAQDSWPCEVLLCVSNPGGMTQFSQCLPPIRRLITYLALGKGFPTCAGGGTRSVKYQKPKNGRPATVTIDYTDGRRATYIVPSANDLPPVDPLPEPVLGDLR